MKIHQLRLAGHLIRFGDDGPYPDKESGGLMLPLWKSKIDEGIWSAGQPELGAELQEAVDDVLATGMARAERLARMTKGTR